MNKIEINIGDLFIYESKYGGVIKGEIAGFNYVHVMDLKLGALKYKYKIKSTKGIWYDLDEVSICQKFYTQSECENITEFVKKAKTKKRCLQEKN